MISSETSWSNALGRYLFLGRLLIILYITTRVFLLLNSTNYDNLEL